MSERERSDAELVEAFRSGDQDAFGVLVHRYVRLAGAIAYDILGDYERAADAAQDAFVKAHASLGSLREPARFKGWFYGVVRSVAIDHRRRRRRGPLSFGAVAGVGEIASASAEPGVGVELAERRERVLAAVARLPEGYREVIVLKYLDERSYVEIAEILGTSVEAVESRLHRARGVLRNKLQGFVRRSGLA
ncbi:RNA polymerase sigma factor [Planctomycetota bacterium]